MRAKGKKLTDEHKTFLVQRLAMFDTPSAAAKAIKEEFGVTITTQAVEHYNPQRHAGRDLAERWVTLFEATRKTFLERLDDIPSANKTVRVWRLENMSVAAQQRGNFTLASALLKQVADEVGNVYTNRREWTGRAGGPIQVEDVTPPRTIEQVEADLVKLLRLDPVADAELMKRLGLDPGPKSD